MALPHHVRRQIRDAFVTLLEGIAPDALRVFNTRKRPTDARQLPCVIVSTPDEALERMAAAPVGQRGMMRTLTVRLEIQVENVDDAEGELDEWAARIEAHLGSEDADFIMRQLVKAWWLSRLATAFDAEGKVSLGGALLEYTVRYHTRDVEPREAA